MHKQSESPDDEIVALEVCGILGIDRSTLIRRVQAGRLIPTRKLPGRTGAYLFRRSDVMAAAAQKASS